MSAVLRLHWAEYAAQVCTQRCSTPLFHEAQFY